MFLRKLTVIILPLALVWGALALAGLLRPLGAWGAAGFGVVFGAALSLLPIVAGGQHGRLPFSRQLLVPAVLLAALLIAQCLSWGNPDTWLPRALAVPDEVTVMVEAIVCGALAGAGLRG